MKTSSPRGASFDAIVIGSGAGGAAATFRLAQAGLRVLLLEKGEALPRDGSTLNIEQVVHRGEFLSHEMWATGNGQEIVPQEHFNLGGKTKWYGAAVLRFSPKEFSGDAAYGARGWPIPYEDLAPYYQEAERMLGVERFSCEPQLKKILASLEKSDPTWESSSLPLALSRNILANTREASHFDGFASIADLKGDAEVSFLGAVRSHPNVVIRTGAEVVDLVAAKESPDTVVGVRLRGGETLMANSILLGAGALHSPRLLNRYVSLNIPTLPAAKHIGRYLKLHLLTALVTVSPSRKTDLLRKTMITVNKNFPHSSLQPLGFDGELIATLVPRVVPRFVANAIGSRAYGFFLQTEDGSSADNRVHDQNNMATNLTFPVIDYNENRTPQSSMEHRQFVKAFRRALFKIGIPSFAQRIGTEGTAHVCGTLSTGSDPKEAVVDKRGGVFGLHGIYVVDGSILPRISRVNPSLSIYAWSLRTADLLSRELIRVNQETSS